MAYHALLLIIQVLVEDKLQDSNLDKVRLGILKLHMEVVAQKVMEVLVVVGTVDMHTRQGVEIAQTLVVVVDLAILDQE